MRTVLRLPLFGFLSMTFFVLLTASVSLYGIPPRPTPARLVNDMAGMMSADQVRALETKLSNYARSHSTQIAIVTVSDHEGYTLAEFADRLGEAWGVGQAGFENGVVIAVNPSGAEGQRRVHISIGYGLEGVIPDIVASRIIDNELLPAFRQARYHVGFDRATDVIMQLAAGEFTADEYTQAQQEEPGWVMFLPLVLIILFVILFANKRKGVYSPGKNMTFWTILMLMSQGSRGGRGGFGGGYSSGRGGGLGGGGFGGFGGGRFGGGGAGGSW